MSTSSFWLFATLSAALFAAQLAQVGCEATVNGAELRSNAVQQLTPVEHAGASSTAVLNASNDGTAVTTPARAHVIQILHPSQGSVVTAGASALLAPDCPTFDARLHELCWTFERIGAAINGPSCVPDTALRTITASPGAHRLTAHLVLKESAWQVAQGKGEGEGGTQEEQDLRKAAAADVQLVLGQPDAAVAHAAGVPIPWQSRVLASKAVAFLAVYQTAGPADELGALQLTEEQKGAQASLDASNATKASGEVVPPALFTPCNEQTWWQHDPAAGVNCGHPAAGGRADRKGWPGDHCRKLTGFRFFLYDLGWEASPDAIPPGAQPGTPAYGRAGVDWTVPALPLMVNRSNLHPGSLDWLVSAPPSKEALALYRVLRDSPFRTLTPSEACIRIALSDLQVANLVGESDALAAARLSLLPAWENGQGHMVFAFGDHRLRYDVGRAIIAGSGLWPVGTPPYAWPSPWLQARGAKQPEPGLAARAGMDIVLPLAFYRCGWPADTHMTRFKRRLQALSAAGTEGLLEGGNVSSPTDSGRHAGIPPPSARPLLLSFKGSVYGFPPDHPASARAALRRHLHNGRDISVQLTCWNRAPSCAPCEPPACDPSNPPLYAHATASESDYPECPAWTEEAGREENDYERLLLDSKFAAIIPGEGPHSYRLAEALAAGAIPVFFPGAVRPLEPLLRWQECGLWLDGHAVPSGEVLTVVESALRGVSDDALAKMQGSCLAMFQSSFSSLEASVHSAFAVLALRYEAAGKARDAATRQDALGLQAQAQDVAAAGSMGAGSMDAAQSAGTPSAAAQALHAPASSTAASAGGSSGAAPALPSGVGVGAGAGSGTAEAARLVPQELPPPIRQASLPPESVTDAALPDLPPSFGPGTASPRLLRLLASLQQPSPSFSSDLTRPPARALHYQPLLTLAAAAVQDAQKAGLGHLQTAAADLIRNYSSHALPGAGAAPTNVSMLAALVQDTLLPGYAANLSALSMELYPGEAGTAGPGPLLDRVAYHLCEAADAWLSFLALGTPGLRDKLHPEVRPALPKIYMLLSQVYSLLGHTRHAATAGHIVHLLTGPERYAEDPGAAGLDTNRVRVTMVDLRSSPATAAAEAKGVPFSHVPIGGLPPYSLGRAVDELHPVLDQARVGGLGVLAHFTGPTPLSSPGGPSIALPVALHDTFSEGVGRVEELSSLPALDALMPSVLVSEAVARVVASRLALQPGFRAMTGPNGGGDTSLRAFRADASLPPITPGAYGRVAVVSMCAYSPGSTVLRGHSEDNLRDYCKAMDAQGEAYDCYLATNITDSNRPPAWSKMPLAAAYLAQGQGQGKGGYAWVVWKDCDTYMMPRETGAGAGYRFTPFEEVLQAAAYSRHMLARVTGSVLKDLGMLDLLSSPTLGSPTGPVLSPQACAHVLPLGSAPTSLLWGEDGFMLNTGVWIARGSGRGSGRSMGQEQAQDSQHAGFALRLLRWSYGEGHTGVQMEREAVALAVHDMQAAAASPPPSPPVPLPAGMYGGPEGSVQAMLSPSLRQSIATLLDNRLWEQGALLAAAGAEHVLLTGPHAQAAGAPPSSSSSPRSVCGRPYPLGAAGAGAGAGAGGGPGWSVHAHSSFLPQAWLNPYPTVIAGVLRDGEGVPLHAVYQRAEGDATVSFSGCTAYYPRSDCEAIFAVYARLARGEAGVAEPFMRTQG